MPKFTLYDPHQLIVIVTSLGNILPWSFMSFATSGAFGENNRNLHSRSINEREKRSQGKLSKSQDPHILRHLKSRRGLIGAGTEQCTPSHAFRTALINR